MESALDQGSYDSDQELEAIRGSVRSLRAQRVAVEQLKEKARQEEGTAEVLRRRLGDAESQIQELRAQGGRDVVRRLMAEVSELRARLKATSAAFQTREKSLADLREAVQELERDRRTAQERFRAQAQKLEEQLRESREQKGAIRRLEEECARREERASEAERRAEDKCSDSGRQLAALSSLLGEANAALDASKTKMEATVAKHTRMLDAARKDKETLLFEKGQAQERMKEVTSLFERQRSDLAESLQRSRELEQEASTAKKETGLAQEQVAKLRVKLSATSLSRKEENVGATRKLRLIAGQAEGLKAELAESKAETAEKGRQLTRYRNEMATFREDVTKLREVAAQQGEMQQAVRDRDETIKDLRQRLELEKRERSQWGLARKQLLLEFCEEENKLRSTLQSGQQQRRQQQQQQQPHDRSPPGGSDRCSSHGGPSHRHPTRHVSSENDKASLRGGSYIARQETRGADSRGDGVLRGFGQVEKRGGVRVGLFESSDMSGGEGKQEAPDYDVGGAGKSRGGDGGKRKGRRTPQRV